MPDNLDLRVRLMNYATVKTELADIRAEITGVGVDSKAASAASARGFSTMHGGLKSMLGVAGIAGVAIGLKDLIRSGMTLQNNQAQLRGALVGAAGGGTAAFGRLNAQMKQLSEHGGFGWSQQLESLTLFLRQTQSVPQAMQAVRASVLLARGAHIDLGVAQHAVASALGGNTWALKQYVKGIVPANKAVIALTVQHRNYLEQLKLQEKFQGNTIAAQEAYYNAVTQADAKFAAQKRAAVRSDIGTAGQEILQEITGNYGGSIDKFNKQTQGKLSNFLNIWKNVMAEAGKSLLPAFNHVVDALTGMGRWLEHNKWVLTSLAIVTSSFAALWAGSKIIGGIMGMYRGLNLSRKMMIMSVKLLTLMGTEADFAGLNAEGVGLAWEGANKKEKEALLTSEAFTAVQETNLTLTEMLDAAIAAFIWPALIMAGIVALSIGILWVITHWKQAKAAASDALGFMGREATKAWHVIESVGVAIGHGFATAFDAVKSGISAAVKFVADKVRWVMNDTPLGALLHLQTGVIGAVGNLLSGHIGAAGSSLLHGVTGAAHAASFGLIGHSKGGLIKPHYYDVGGPVGTDTIPGWLSPGEYVINSSAASQFGYGALSAINAGNANAGQHITIVPAPVNINIDGRRLAQAVVRYTVERAARGPSSLVGGSLPTGLGGPTHVYD